MPCIPSRGDSMHTMHTVSLYDSMHTPPQLSFMYGQYVHTMQTKTFYDSMHTILPSHSKPP
jgi:hypothetical protein